MKFEYKYLECKPVGLVGHWFDGPLDLGSDMSSSVLTTLGLEGWEVVGTTNSAGGHTSGIILKKTVS